MQHAIFRLFEEPPDRDAKPIQEAGQGQLVGGPVPVASTAPNVGFGLGNASVLGDRLLLVGNSNEGAQHRSWRFGRVFDASLQPVTDRFLVGLGFVGSGDVAVVGDRWLAVYSWKSTHDAPRSGVAYNYIGVDGATGGDTTLVSSYPDNGTPTVVSTGVGSAEAMIMFQRQDLPPELGGPYWFPRSGEGLIGQRMGADGTRIGDLITLVDEPGASFGARATFDGSNYVVSWVDTREHVYPRQEVPDVYAARVAVDGTVLDPGGVPVANTAGPEDSPEVASGGGHTFFVYRQFRYGPPHSSYRVTTRLLDDETPPEPEGGDFDPDQRQAMALAFDERLYDVQPADLVVQNLTTGQSVNAAAFAVAEATGAAGSWGYTFRPAAGGYLPDGNYRVTLPAGSVADKAGNPLAEDATLDFFVLRGDANGDRRVNVSDFGILRANFGGSGKTWAQGDFNYDGLVNVADFGILRANFGTYLPPPGGGNLFGGGGGEDGDGGGDGVLG